MSSSFAVSIIVLDLVFVHQNSSKPKRSLMDLIVQSNKAACSSIKDILVSSEVLR